MVSLMLASAVIDILMLDPFSRLSRKRERDRDS